MADFPIIKWETVDDKNVPFSYPQHEKGNGDFVKTGENNPLPTVSYGQTEGGILIPQKLADDGTTLTQLTGSIAQNDYLENVIVPAGSTVDIPILKFQSKLISIGILLDNLSKFSFRTISRAASSNDFFDSITHETLESTRTITRIELRSGNSTVRLQNEGVESFTINVVSITEFSGEV